MNVNLVRIIDYWIGAPVCFALTVFNAAAELAGLKRKIREPKKFLFIELSEMGSAILAYPAMAYLKKNYPDAELFFLIFAKNRASVDILNMMPRANVLTLDDRNLFFFFRDVIKFIVKIRKEKIDVAFDLELFARSTAILSFLSGAPKRIGFHKYDMEGLYRGNLLTHKVQYNFQQHMSKSFLSFVKIAGLTAKKSPAVEERITDKDIVLARYVSSKEQLDNIRKKLSDINPAIASAKKLIILNPSGGEIPIRAWPTANYISLAKKILNDKDNFVILMGAARDEKMAQSMQTLIDDERCLNLAGQTTFTELMDLFNAADILITNDSGPAHFASLTPIKSFVFFGPETPVLYAPLGAGSRAVFSGLPCSPCLSAFNHRSSACRDNKCLRIISVDEVYDILNL